MVKIVRPLVFLVVLVLLPGALSAQSARIGVYKQDGTPACSLAPGTLYFLNIKLTATSGPVQTARFELVPSCPPAIIYGSLEYNLTFTPCIEAGATMATVVVQTPAVCGGFGFYFDVAPASGDSKIGLTDCDGYPMTGADAIHAIDYSPCDTDDHMIAPYRPTPADGATDVPLNALLSYVGPANSIELSTSPLPPYFSWSDDTVICGYSYCLPNEAACTYPVNPGPLIPHTRYYWRASTLAPTHDWCIDASSEVFTFTTGDAPLAIEAATWGHVKAMYRD